MGLLGGMVNVCPGSTKMHVIRLRPIYLPTRLFLHCSPSMHHIVWTEIQECGLFLGNLRL